MNEEPMSYVATWPDDPDAAWAAIVDAPEYKDRVAGALAEWIKEGGVIQRVDTARAREMLGAWFDKRKRERESAAQGELFTNRA